NLLDSHDVSRFYSVCKENKKAYHLALVFLMTFCGIPCLFYGDELCLSGVEEKDYRQSMPWEKVKDPKNNKDLEFLHSLLNLRNNEKTLQEGVFTTLRADNENHLLIYERNLKNKDFKKNEKGIVIFINNDDYSHKIKVNINSEVLLSEGFERNNNLKGSLSGFGFLIIKEK
ncbi:MAG: alpha-amylase family glycosyl hydrolase, partial [Sphaerochaetaceae bacterium]|nr:alpha-amylase family glycosyl hydrolase [Sphaerochaetaceae bacterium]